MLYVLTLYLPRVIYFILLVIQVNSFEKFKKYLLVVTTSALFYGMLVMVLGWGVQGRLAYGGVYDPNDMAYVMVSLFPPALLFWSRSEKLTRRITALATFGIALLLILLTQSRGGFLGLAAVMVLLLISPASGIKKTHRILIVALSAILLGSFSAYINLERVESMENIKSDYNLTEEFGRISIWKRGMRMALEHPMTGVGVDCFSMALAQQRQMEGLIPKWQVTHNSYIQVIAETGAVGFLLMVSLILGTLKNLGRQIPADPAHPEFVEYNRAGRLLQFAFIGHCICAFFLTQGYSILFILFFGLSAAKRNIEAKDFGLTKSVHRGAGR
jgi:putative inorganic carbon (HCO3(-)) transporter